MKKLHPKISQLKKRTSPILFEELKSTPQTGGEYPGSDLANRIVAGYTALWKSRNDRGWQWLKGAFSKSIKERGPESNAKQQIKFLYMHDTFDPLSLFEKLAENDTGFYFRTKPLDPVPSADRLLIQLESGTVNNFSMGVYPDWTKAEYDEASDTVVFPEGEVHEISPVSMASDSETYRLNSVEEYNRAIEYLDDEVEAFIKTLPRAEQLGARMMFKRYKTLLSFEPSQEQSEDTHQQAEPAKSVETLTQFIIKNLNKQ